MLKQRLNGHRLGSQGGASQVISLRVWAVFQSQTPFGVHLARDDKFLKALWSTVYVKALQQLQQCRCLEFKCAVAMRVVLANQQGQFLAVSWHFVAFVDGFDQAQPFVLVGNVPWPLAFGRKAFA